ncbi:MAG: PIN domain-containing protein [Parvularculaceae bacterium]|nr:PIN domain-containing protein [Parvularculaceae bacterium]
MIAADASSLSSFLAGEEGDDVEKLADALAQDLLRLPPVVVTEILTDPRIGKLAADRIGAIQLLDIEAGYWRRAGETRATLRRRGLKANVADALIAQSCIDHGVALITRDHDFRHFAKHCGLKLA